MIPPTFQLTNWNGTIELQNRWIKTSSQDGPLTVQAEFLVNLGRGGVIHEDLAKRIEKSIVNYFKTHKIQWNVREKPGAYARRMISSEEHDDREQG